MYFEINKTTNITNTKMVYNEIGKRGMRVSSLKAETIIGKALKDIQRDLEGGLHKVVDETLPALMELHKKGHKN